MIWVVAICLLLVCGFCFVHKWKCIGHMEEQWKDGKKVSVWKVYKCTICGKTKTKLEKV